MHPSELPVVEVPTLSGAERLKIPHGTQPGQVFRLRNKGFPHLRGSGSGDQVCRVTVEVPAKLTAKQKELLKEFDCLTTESCSPATKSFWDTVKELFGEKNK